MVQKEQRTNGLSFTGYYEELKAQPLQFRKMVAKDCGVTENAVYRWLAGVANPDKLKKEQISKLLNTPVSILFPEK